MTKSRYSFSEGFNKDVQDKIPEWMETLVNSNIEKKEVVKINNLYGNADNQTRKCSMCKKILSNNEINICTECIKIKK